MNKATIELLCYHLQISEKEVRQRLVDSADRRRAFYQDCREMALSPFHFEATTFVKYRALRLKVVTPEEMEAVEARARDAEASRKAQIEESKKREIEANLKAAEAKRKRKTDGKGAPVGEAGLPSAVEGGLGEGVCASGESDVGERE